MWIAKKDLAMEMEEKEKQRQGIIQSRRRNELDEAMECGFNISDVMIPSPTKPTNFIECSDPPAHLLTIEETGPYQEWRMNSLNMVKSQSYEDKLDGNCVLHTLSDQLNNVLHIKAPANALDFRLETVVSLVSNRHFLEYETLTIDQWISKYTLDQVHVSHLALQLISNKYKVKIYVYSLFEIDGIVEILPLSPNGVVPHVADCHVLHLSEVRCHNGHYISLRHKAGNFNS